MDALGQAREMWAEIQQFAEAAYTRDHPDRAWEDETQRTRWLDEGWDTYWRTHYRNDGRKRSSVKP